MNNKKKLVAISMILMLLLVGLVSASMTMTKVESKPDVGGSYGGG